MAPPPDPSSDYFYEKDVQTQILHGCSSGGHNTPLKPVFSFTLSLPVDDLLREAKVGPNGTIKYEELVRIVCLPPVNY